MGGLEPGRGRRSGDCSTSHLAVVLVVLFVVLAVGAMLLRTALRADSVTESEARAYLTRAVDAGLARDFDALCALNGSAFNCRRTLEGEVTAAAPDEAPTSVEVRWAPKGNGNQTAGWVLTVVGRDGLDKPYRTEVMVFREGRDLTAINIVWWSGARLVLGDLDDV